MRAGIIVFPGTNCDIDTKRACKLAGWETKFIWHDETDLNGFDVIFLPGGFSYGDYIRAGRLAKFSPAVMALNDYVASGLGMVVGICNGFQILCETKLLPGILSVNQGTKFICDVVPLEVSLPDCPSEASLPIAHAEGCYVATEETLNSLKEKNMIFLKYKENPNGSVNNIAGLYDRDRKVIGLMPHPERSVFEETGSTDGRFFFSFIESELKN